MITLDTLTVDAFLHDHVMPGVPVLVSRAGPSIDTHPGWTWDGIIAAVPDHQVATYGDWFTPTARATLHAAVRRIADGGAEPGDCGYLRLGLDPDEGVAVLSHLERWWRQPAFLPNDGYVVPRSSSARPVDAATDAFPYRSVLMSAVGGGTRMHRDPWTSAAVLVQVIGRKRLWLYEPDLGVALEMDGELIDPVDPHWREVARPEPTDVVDIGPGDVLYLPGGWVHRATTIEPAVTLTWNFVHQCRAADLVEHILLHADDPELDVLRRHVEGDGVPNVEGRTA